MLHHISFGTGDIERAVAFYDATLAALGYVRVWSQADGAGYGLPGGEEMFALKLQSEPLAAPGTGFHLAFAAPSREAVTEFHAAAVRSGGRDDGPPGVRPQYGEDYFAAYVTDPDGYRIEAVFSGPVPSA